MKKVYIKTFGCQMNAADSAEMLLALSARGFAQTDKLEEADAVLINTCTIREAAEHKAISYIGRVARWKAKKAGRIVIATGCAVERLGKKVKARFPHVDILSGAKSIEKFSSQIDVFGLKGENLAAQDNQDVSAFVTIMRGCNFKCAYCIVPSVRGQAVSLDPEEIKRDVLLKVQAGVSEITLLGQTVNAYCHKNMPSFSALLKELNTIPQIKRIRFLSPHPSFLTDELIETMASCEKIARHIHLPVQSGSDRVLKLMNRPYTRAEVLCKIKKLKALMPTMAVSTDIIVGFPTETEAEFMESISLLEEIETSFAFCFKYSPREGTASAEAMPDDVNESEKERRLSVILEKEQQLCKRQLLKQKGVNCAILMEAPKKGRTSENYWVKTQDTFKPGELVNAYIEDLNGTILIARSLL